MGHRARSLLLVVMLAWASGCALFGANLPPGNAGPSFVEQPEGLPALSANMRERRRALDDAARAEVDRNFALLEDLVRSSAALREQMRRAKQQIEAGLLDEGQLRGLERELLLEGAHWYIELDLLLYNVWTSYRGYLPYASEPDPYAPYRGASLLSSDTRTKGGLVALSAEVVRMDNARVVLEMLDGQWAITQFLNRGDDARGIEPESFDRMVGAFRDPDRRSLLKSQLGAVTEARATLDELARRDGEVAFLLSLLDESAAASELRDETSVGRQARFAFAVASRSGVALLSPFLSAYIATVLAEQPVDTRAVRRLAATPGARDTLLDELRPLDVLVLRDLTRTSTGAAYTHAVIYLGDYATLKEPPLSSHLAVTVHKAELRRGHTFLDISQRGSRLLELDDVLAAQDVAVLRYPLPADAAAQVQRRALDAVVSREFLTPPQLTQREHAARLLWATFGDVLGVPPRRGDRAPSLVAVLERASDDDAEAQVVFATLDGAVMAESERKDAIRRTLERQGPLDDVTVQKR